MSIFLYLFLFAGHLLYSAGDVSDYDRDNFRKASSSSSVKRSSVLDADEDGHDPPRNIPIGQENPLPPGFLSPSVQEYLELGKSIPGKAGTDYPVLSTVPYTNFYCDEQPYPGFFADEETRCQAWHYCDIDGRQASFLCPNGTQFSQAVFVCDWWFNVRCELSRQLYPINERLYGIPKKSLHVHTELSPKSY